MGTEIYTSMSEIAIPINMPMSLTGLRSEKGCAGDARQKLKTTDARNCLKIIKERMEKIGRGS
jgi:hypothetical protein